MATLTIEIDAARDLPSSQAMLTCMGTKFDIEEMIAFDETCRNHQLME
jgi:hypothetical protein